MYVDRSWVWVANFSHVMSNGPWIIDLCQSEWNLWENHEPSQDSCVLYIYSTFTSFSLTKTIKRPQFHVPFSFFPFTNHFFQKDRQISWRKGVLEDWLDFSLFRVIIGVWKSTVAHKFGIHKHALPLKAFFSASIEEMGTMEYCDHVCVQDLRQSLSFCSVKRWKLWRNSQSA